MIESPDNFSRAKRIVVVFITTNKNMTLLLPERLQQFAPAELKSVNIKTGPLQYATVGNGPEILVFHGTGSSFFTEIALEMPLVEAGYRLIVPHRPGYPGTSFSHGRTASECAVMAAKLLAHLDINRVIVLGTSGGGPAAIQFASRYGPQTSALILQCAVSHPWIQPHWEPQSKKFKIPLVRQPWVRKAINWFAPRIPAKILYPQTVGSLEALVGPRWYELKDYEIIVALAKIFHTSRTNWHSIEGILNDLEVFFGAPWLQPDSFSGPTMIIHDEFDNIVPFEHARHAKKTLTNAELVNVEAGGHLIWIGNDALKMHQSRLEFIERHCAN